MNDSLRRLVPAAYAVALFFLLSPVIDVATNVWPFSPGDEQWRYGASAVLSNYLVSVLYGMLLAALVAGACGHARVLRVLGVIALVLVALLLLVELELVLDTLQLHNIVRPEQADAFKIGSLKAGVKMGLVLVALLVLGVGAIRATRSGERRAAR